MIKSPFLEKQKDTSKKGASPFFTQLVENIDQLSGEKIKIFELLNELSLNASSFPYDLYLEGAFLLLSNVEKLFIETRSSKVLIWLLEQLSIRKKVKQNSKKQQCELHTFNHVISFPFREKEVLSLFIILDGTSVNIDAVKRRILEEKEDVIFVEGSLFCITNRRMQTTKIHFEIQKKEGVFSEKELSLFQETIPQDILDLIDPLKPSLIVPSNRELLMKSFRWIMNELQAGDLPHIFIDFSKQTASAFQFSALVCSMKNSSELSLQTHLQHPDIHIEGSTILKDKEGAILEIDIPYHPSLSLIDARKKSSLLIQSLIGPCRDINGGLLEKIDENFQLFAKEVSAPIEILQAFFYGISPQEKQATTPVFLLKAVYHALIQQKKGDKEFDYTISETKEALCVTVKIPHKSFEREFRHFLLSHFPQLLFASTNIQTTNIISCALLKRDPEESENLKNLSFSFYQQWLEKKEVKQILRLCSTRPFISFDPRMGTEEEPSCFHKMLFEGLMHIGPDGTPENGIAEKVEISNRGHHYRFFLRKSFWSNGKPLTAYDFAHSWKMRLKPEYPSPLSYLFYPIKNAQEVKEGKLSPETLGIHVIDDLILDVKLYFPAPQFLELCAHSAFSPICQTLDRQNPSWPEAQGIDYVCNGPFKLDKSKKKETFILRKNPFYWEKDRVHLEKVIVQFLTESESLHLFQKKEIDALLHPFWTNEISFSIQNQEFKECEGIFHTRYLCCNCSRLPFQNKKLRQAISLALQREKLAFHFSKKAFPHYSLYSHYFTQIEIDKEKEENPFLAQKLFSEALQEMGKDWKEIVHQEIYVTSRHDHLAQLMIKQLNEVFDLHWRYIVIDSPTLLSLAGNGKMNLSIYGWIDRILDPSYFLEIFSSAKNIENYSFWTNEKLQSLIQKIRKTPIPEKRRNLSAEAEKLLHQEKPMIPLLYAPTYSLFHLNIHNIHTSRAQQFDIRYSYKT